MRLKLVESESIGRPRLDRERGIVRGVKILGSESAHGYTYTGRAMKNAVTLYEGMKVNVNHPDRKKLNADRAYQDRFGRFRNVEYREGKGLFGDFHYNRGHQIARQFEWDVVNDPNACGFSHNASGSAYREGKKVFVESIEKVRSVDLVADPATNIGLFESRGARFPMKIKLRKKRKLTESRRERRASASRNQRRMRHYLNEFLEAAAIEPDGDESSQPTTKQAMAQMLQAVFLDDSLDPDEKKTKILAILALEEKQDMSGDDSGDSSSDSSDSGDSTDSSSNLKESKGAKNKVKAKERKKKQLRESKGGDKVQKLETELKNLKHRDRVLELCESQNFRPSKVQLQAIMALPTKKEAKELIESMAEGTSRRPKGVKSGAPEGERRTQKEVKTEDWLEGLVVDNSTESFRVRRKKAS